MDLSLEPRLFRQMVQRLLKSVGQHTDQHLRLGPSTVVVPRRAQQQLALEDPERMLYHSELHVRFPQRFGRPA